MAEENQTEISVEVFTKAKHAGGRPTSYDPAFCELVEELGKQGASVVQMAYACGVVKQTLFNWAKDHPEFLDAFTRAQTASQSWWELAGQKGMFMTGFSASAWSRSMAARFPADWRENKAIELSGPGGRPIDTRDVSNMTAKEIAEIYQDEVKG